MALAFGSDELHPMVDTLLRQRVPRWRELNRAIDERDDMLDFALGFFEHDRDMAVTSYFQNGLEQFALVRHIASWRGPVGKFLDFASGYGRLTRFLIHEGFAADLTVSDILDGGMEFQAQQFGVRTVLSTMTPEDFNPGDRYDFIFVASLFTHLPPALFREWLARLVSLLEPEGLLVFSVHDEAIAGGGVEEGISFAAHSESRVLDRETYGSTWVTEAYVKDQISRIGGELQSVRLPRALGDWQDVYVVSPGSLKEARPWLVPKGFLDHFVNASEGLRLSGWARSPGGGEADRIEVRIDDEPVVVTRDFTVRPDVNEVLGLAADARSAWNCLIPHAAVHSFRYQVLTVSAFSPEGFEKILFLGPVDSIEGALARQRDRAWDEQVQRRDAVILELRSRADDLERRKRELEVSIAAMRQSRFWRARDLWFGIKGWWRRGE